jgi:hypothetical protein
MREETEKRHGYEHEEAEEMLEHRTKSQLQNQSIDYDSDVYDEYDE